MPLIFLATGLALTGNFLTLAGMLIGAAVSISVAIITTNRSAHRDRDDLKNTVVGGYLDSVQRSDEIQKSVADSHNEVLVKLAATFAEHATQDAANFGEIRDDVHEMKRDITALADVVKARESDVHVHVVPVAVAPVPMPA